MSIEVKVPVLPESVSDAVIAAWHKKVGEAVSRDENLLDLETDKVVLEVPSPVDGVLESISAETGDTVTSQQVIAIIKEGAAAAPAKAEAPKAAEKSAPASAPAKSGNTADLSPAGRRVAVMSTTGGGGGLARRRTHRRGPRGRQRPREPRLGVP